MGGGGGGGGVCLMQSTFVLGTCKTTQLLRRAFGQSLGGGGIWGTCLLRSGRLHGI